MPGMGRMALFDRDGVADRLARDARMSAHGIVVWHFSPGRLSAEPRLVAGEIRSALEAGWRRDGLDIRALPPL
jgi:hypothetical protein